MINLTNNSGRVASLHLHPMTPGTAFSDAASIEVVSEKGIVGNPRYFGRLSSSGKPGKRQVTLIERARIAEHAATLGLGAIAPGAVRSNIETEGINLVNLIGQKVRIGAATLYFYEARTPCAKMDALYPGLHKLMENGRQGVLAQVITDGMISIGDTIEPVRQSAPQ